MKQIWIILLFLAIACEAGARSFEVKSPDGKYIMTLADENDFIEYCLSWNGRRIINPSRLGIESGQRMYEGLQIAEVFSLGEVDEEWTPVYGERNLIRDHYNEYRVSLSKISEGVAKPVSLAIEIRAYDEGVAFRYDFTGGQYLKIIDEFTEFTVPEGTQAYFTSRAQTEYSLLSLSNWPGDGQAERPLLLKLPGKGFLCLAEAQVVDYVRTKFYLSGKSNTIATAMYGPVEEIAPYHTPWRVLMCADQAGDILQNNYIFYNLNPSCQIDDTSWIKPGKVMREITLSTEGAMALVDFAAERNLQYIHFDAGWYGSEYDKSSDATAVTLDPKRNPKIDALDLQKVIRYAKSKKIGVFLYVNQRALQQQLDEILPIYQAWGVAGLKFGFVQVGS